MAACSAFGRLFMAIRHCSHFQYRMPDVINELHIKLLFHLIIIIIDMYFYAQLLHGQHFLPILEEPDTGLWQPSLHQLLPIPGAVLHFIRSASLHTPIAVARATAGDAWVVFHIGPLSYIAYQSVLHGTVAHLLFMSMLNDSLDNDWVVLLAGHLEALDLTSFGLSCALPSASLALFSSLETLVLSDNPELVVCSSSKSWLAIQSCLA